MPEAVFNATSLTPRAVDCGDSVTFVITLEVGDGYTDGPSRLIFDFPGTIGMSRPSLLHQEDFGFISVYVSNPDVAYEQKIWDMEVADFYSLKKMSWRGMAARMAVVDLAAGLRSGDVIQLRWGEQGRGFGPTTRVTHMVPKPDYESTIDVRYFERTDDRTGLPDFGRSFEGCPRPEPVLSVPLAFKIRPREPDCLQLIRTPDRAVLNIRDRFWNLARVGDVEDHVTADAEASQTPLGSYELKNVSVQVKSKGLPLLDAPGMRDVFEGYNLYWGDIHTHSCHSVDCIEREKLAQTPSDLAEYARVVSGLSFYAPSDHHQPWDKPRHRLPAAAWEETLDAVRRFNDPGSFLVFPAFEYRCKRGDTVVVLKDEVPHAEIDVASWKTIRDLWAGFTSTDYITIPHFHNPGGLPEGEWWENAAGGVETAMEVFSCHGSYEHPDTLEGRIPMMKKRRPDRFANWFLQKGCKYGFCANSDGHKGVAGTNGITAVFAKSLDKDAIFEAFRARRIYGSSNARIRLVFTGNGHLMGSAVRNERQKTFLIDAVGDNRLKKIELFKNGTLHQRVPGGGSAFARELTVDDEEPGAWHVRVTQIDNQFAFSSPVFFEQA